MPAAVSGTDEESDNHMKRLSLIGAAGDTAPRHMQANKATGVRSKDGIKTTKTNQAAT